MKIFKNFSFLVIGKLLGDVFTFLMFVTISRKFGQEGIGEYSFAMALTSFLMKFSDFGLTNLSIKEMSRYRQKILQYYSELLTVRIFLIVIALILLLVISTFLDLSERAFNVMIMVGTYQILYSVLDGVGSIFIATEKMLYKGILEFSAKSSSAVICIAIIYYNGGLAESLISLPVVIIIHIMMAHILITQRMGKLNLHMDWYRSIEIIKESSSYAYFIILYQIATRIDVILLGLLLGNAAAGVYNVAYRVVFLILFLSYFGSMAIFPLASRLYKQSKDELINLYRKTFNIIILIGLPVAAGIWLIAPEFIVVVFGEEFSESVYILRILSVVIFLSTINIIIGVFLTASDRQACRTKNQLICALGYAIGNISLIPIYGIKGAAFAAIMAELLLVILSVWKLGVFLGWPKNVAYRLLASVTGVSAFCIPLESLTPVSLYLMIPLSVIIYVFIVLMFKDIRDQEMAFITGLFRK